MVRVNQSYVVYYLMNPPVNRPKDELCHEVSVSKAESNTTMHVHVGKNAHVLLLATAGLSGMPLTSNADSE